MDELESGYRRFRDTTWPVQRARFEALAEKGQSPHTLVVACSDSRSDPAMVFDVAPGELFVVRNVANLVPPYAPDGHQHGVSAALEFGVRVLKVGRIVVMGHGACGGVNAALNGVPHNCRDFVAPWMAQAEPAIRAAAASCPPGETELALLAAERAVVRLSVTNLRSFPWIAEREAAGDLKLAGMHFAIATGVLSEMAEDGTFRALD